MSTMLISFCSVKGSPGVTSTALAAAAVWPRPVMLLEADPAGGDLAYRCISAAGGPPPAGKSLLTLAAGVRGGSVSPRTVAEHAQMLACGVHLVQGVTSPAQARGLGSLWAEVAEAVRGSEVDVIVDLGRLDRSSVTMPIAQVSDFLVPVAASSLESVMHLRDQLPELALAIRQHGPGRIAPVLVGPDAHAGRDCGDLDALLERTGVDVAPASPVTVDHRALQRLEAGEKGTGRLGRSLLLRATRLLAESLLGEKVVAR